MGQPFRTSYGFDFIGEGADGVQISIGCGLMTKLHAELKAKEILRRHGGGFVDIFITEGHEFVCTVTV